MNSQRKAAGLFMAMFVPLVLVIAFFPQIRAAKTAETQPEKPSLNLVSNELQRGQGPVQVGEFETANRRIRYDDPDSWRQVIFFPEAAYIKVHFAQIDLQPGDVVRVTDANGGQARTYPDSSYTFAQGEKGIWAVSVVGDTAVIELVKNANPSPINEEEAFYYEQAQAGASLEKLGIHIDKYARGYPEYELGRDPDSTCGTNQRTDVACYETSHPLEFNTVDAVARILVNGNSHCTGWRVSPGNFMMSNEHCISSQSELNQMEFWFNYQRPMCQNGNPNGDVTIVTGDTFLIDDFTLDFSLFTLDNFATIQSFGYLVLDPRMAILGEEIYIGQHGAGNPKEFGIESDFNPPNNLCQIDDVLRNGYGNETDMGYFCDTTGGSSGSPVIARSTNKVIAIHHFGTGGAACGGDTMNAGVRIELIWPLVEPFLVNVSMGSSSLNTLPGTTVTHSIPLENLDNTDTFTVALQAGNWPTTLLTPAQVTIPQGMSETIEVSVNVPHLPLSETVHGSDTFTVTATSSNDPGIVVEGYGTTNAVTNPALTVSGDDAATAPQGSIITYTVAVTNTGDYTDTFAVDLNGNSWPVSSQSATVGPLGTGESGPVEIYVTVQGVPATDSVTITFTSDLDTSVSDDILITSTMQAELFLPVVLRE